MAHLRRRESRGRRTVGGLLYRGCRRDWERKAYEHRLCMCILMSKSSIALKRARVLRLGLSAVAYS